MTRPTLHPGARRAFSLTEVLLAIGILGLGLISIASLFPAGIAQQQQSTDDVLGPTVAANALAVLRAKLDRAEFGTFEEFDPDPFDGAPLSAPVFTVEGDWGWLRPAYLFEDDTTTDVINEIGAIDVFARESVSGSLDTAPEFPGGYAGASPRLDGIPYNRSLDRDGDGQPDTVPPRILISQEERYYPMGSGYSSDPTIPRPQYVWDCMFRRFQGRVLVAVFVYRVTRPGGLERGYRVAPADPVLGAPAPPPLPVRLELAADPASGNWSPVNASWCNEGPWDADGDPIILGATGAYDPEHPYQSWQQPRQWIIDQNNNVHRVLSSVAAPSADAREIELQRPVPTPGSYDFASGSGFVSPVFSVDRGATSGLNPNEIGITDVVSELWYLPALDDEGFVLTPVYVTIKEL